MKNPARIIATGLFALSLHASAQSNVRIQDPTTRLTKKEQKRLDTQAINFYEAVEPAVASAAKSTVTISYRGHRLSYGTAISADGKILTKWSEISPASQHLTVTTADGKRLPALVTGIYKEHDLAVIKCASHLTPIIWATKVTPKLGDFIALATPSGQASGLGVVSVNSRSLRENDKAYLGVVMDFSLSKNGGTPLKEVMRGSAAAKAGLKAGDIVVAIGQNEIQGAVEMRNVLQRLVPGSEVLVRYRRGNADRKTKVLLGSRGDNKDIRRIPQARMSKMQSMGTIPSKVRKDFPQVIQSDMAINPDDAGAPIVDLDGNVIGISIARGSRIKTFIIPSQTVLKVLATKPQPYSSDLASAPIDRNSRVKSHRSVKKPTNIHEDFIDQMYKELADIDGNNIDVESIEKLKAMLRKIKRSQNDER